MSSTFLGLPEAWLDDPHYACERGHVSTHILLSEARGDTCLACLGPVRLVPPDTQEGAQGAAAYQARTDGTSP